MNLTLLIVVILTAIALVGIALKKKLLSNQ